MPSKHTMNPLDQSKDDRYFQHSRDDVLDSILKQGITAKKVLELGCSSGHVGAKLKQSLNVQEYVGVEIERQAADAAATRLDKVLVADLAMTSPEELGLAAGEFDLLLALDVLEHLVNPWDVLAAWVALLKPGGHVVVSIPNVQNIEVLLKLLQGKWEYESAGLLDATHLRFFTRESIEKLLIGAGLKVVRSDGIIPPGQDLSRLQEAGNTATFNNITITNLTRQQVIELCTYQYIMIAQKPT